MKYLLIIVSTIFLNSILFGQSTWYEIPTGTNKKLNSIDFPSNNVGYVVGNDSLILKTIDGGQTWQELGMNGIQLSTSGDENFSDVDFVDEDNGFIVCGYSGVFQTSDGGQTWSVVAGQTSNMWLRNAVYPLSSSDYFIGGSGYFEGAMVDRFANGAWTSGSISAFLLQYQYLEEFSFSGQNRGLAATKGPYMLRTIDSGLTWDTISTGISGDLTSVLMVDDNLCYAGYDIGGSSFGILKSTDGGLTWDFDPNLGTSALFINPNYLSVCKAHNGDVYSGANTLNSAEGVIFETPDGVLWSNTYVSQPINDMTSHGSDITFGVGDSGYIVVNTPIANLGISQINALEFDVYPNPVQNELTIYNPHSEEMEVVISHASGRVLTTEFSQSGHSTIDCSKLSSGIYFVKVRIGNQLGLKRLVK